jgi:hypothetical protein
MRKSWILAALTVASPVALRAQADSARRDNLGEVAGVVYDSVARGPIAGAIIQLVLATDPDREVHGTTSDAKGRFVISGVKPGRYVIGFLHEALDSLALEPPLRAVEIRAGERAKVDLAVPSPATIVTALCGVVSKADSTGLLIGMLRDARTRLPLDTGSIEATWQEIMLGGTSINMTDRRVNSAVTKEGWFALCDVPAGVDFAVTAQHGADSTGYVALTVPVGGLARHDLFVGGTAAIRGVVVSEKNQPLRNARIAIVGRERMVMTDSSGGYRLRDIPAGSQTVEIRALGYAPELKGLTLPAESDSTLNVTLTSVKRVLDTIHVVGQRVYSRDSNGFLRRKRMGGGTFFDQETVRREKPFEISRLLYRVPSLTIMQRGFDRRILMRGGFGGGYCSPTLYLDGVKMSPEMLAELDFVVRPEELEGMEVYRSTNMPPQFSNFNGCGSIVVWTRPPVKAKKG